MDLSLGTGLWQKLIGFFLVRAGDVEKIQCNSLLTTLYLMFLLIRDCGATGFAQAIRLSTTHHDIQVFIGGIGTRITLDGFGMFRINILSLFDVVYLDFPMTGTCR